MTDPLYTKIKKENLLRRIRIFRVLVYVAGAIAAGSFAYCIIDWKGWSWILIGTTYVMLAINFRIQVRAIKQELARREEWRAARAKANQ
jgi:fatty acid desaturase